MVEFLSLLFFFPNVEVQRLIEPLTLRSQPTVAATHRTAASMPSRQEAIARSLWLWHPYLHQSFECGDVNCCLWCRLRKVSDMSLVSSSFGSCCVVHTRHSKSDQSEPSRFWSSSKPGGIVFAPNISANPVLMSGAPRSPKTALTQTQTDSVLVGSLLASHSVRLFCSL